MFSIQESVQILLNILIFSSIGIGSVVLGPTIFTVTVYLTGKLYDSYFKYYLLHIDRRTDLRSTYSQKLARKDIIRVSKWDNTKRTFVPWKHLNALKWHERLRLSPSAKKWLKT